MRSRGSSGRTAPVDGAAAGVPDRPARRPPFALIASITVTGILANTLITPAVPNIIREFEVGDAAAGLILATATAPGIVLAPVMGVLADRFGRRTVILPCLILFGISGGMAGFAQSFGAFLVLRLLQGVGSAGMVNLGVVLIADHWEGVERTKMMGRNGAILTSTIVVLPPIGGLLTKLGGWRLTFAPYWVALLTAAAVFVMLPRSRAVTGASLRDQVAGVKAAMHSRRLLGCFALGFVLFALVFGVFLTVVPLHLENDFGVDADGRGVVLALPAITSTIFALNVGRFRRRFGAAAVVSATMFGLVVGFGLIAAAGTLFLLAVGCLVYGAAEGALFPTLQDTVASSSPADNRAAVMSSFVGTIRAGQTAGPVAAAAGYERFGAGPVVGVAAVVSAVMAVAALGLRRGRNRQAERRSLAGTDESPLT